MGQNGCLRTEGTSLSHLKKGNQTIIILTLTRFRLPRTLIDEDLAIMIHILFKYCVNVACNKPGSDKNYISNVPITQGVQRLHPKKYSNRMESHQCLYSYIVLKLLTASFSKTAEDIYLDGTVYMAIKEWL